MIDERAGTESPIAVIEATRAFPQVHHKAKASFLFKIAAHTKPHPLFFPNHHHSKSATASSMSDNKVDQPTTQSFDSPNGKEAPKAIIKNVDMSEEMQQEAVDVTSAALEKYNIEKDIAAQIKKEFDRRHGPTWHVVVGKNFGSYVTHGECCVLFPCHSRQFAPIAVRRVETRPPTNVHLLLARAPIDLFACRNEALHLLLRRTPRRAHLEVIKSVTPPTMNTTILPTKL